MIAYYAATGMIAAAIGIGAMSPSCSYAQTAAAATKQMQDTQRAAHQKARNAKKNTHSSVKKQNESASGPTSSAN